MIIDDEIFKKMINQFGGNGINAKKFIDFKIPKKDEKNSYYYLDDSNNLNLLEIGKNCFNPFEEDLKTFAKKRNIDDDDILSFNSKYGATIKDNEDLSSVRYKNIYNIPQYRKSDIKGLVGKGIADLALNSDSYIIESAELMVDNKILLIQLNHNNFAIYSRQIPSFTINGYPSKTIRALSGFYGNDIAKKVIRNKDKYIVLTEKEIRKQSSDNETSLSKIVNNIYGDHEEYENKEILNWKNDYYVVVTKYDR